MTEATVQNPVSLKSQVFMLARLTGLSHDRIYERQRELIRQGALPAPAGRGRGNGTPFTPDGLAILIIDVLANSKAHEIETIYQAAMNYGQHNQEDAA